MVDGRDALFLAFKSGYQNLFVTMHLPDSLGGGMHYLGSDAKGLDVEVKHLHMVLTPDGRPVVVYYPQGGSGTLEAMEWVGTLGSPPVGTWSPIGKARTIGSASYSAPSVAVGADGTLYVAFADDLRDYRLTVRMFAPNADTEWQPVGPPGFSDTCCQPTGGSDALRRPLYHLPQRLLLWPAARPDPELGRGSGRV